MSYLMFSKLFKKTKSKKTLHHLDKVPAFHNIVPVILAHEGGYVWDKDDPGGETNFGISKRAFPKIDIKKLKMADAVKIYLEYYWKPSKVELLPRELWKTYFDMCVNMGQKKACEVLQRSCNHKNKKEIKVDGKLGPKTARAAKSLEPERLISFRVMYYANLVRRNPKLMKYYYGWYRRASST